MNAYLTCDRIEDRRWANQQIQDEKDKWIDDRAQELISMFPDKPLLMSSLFYPKKPSWHSLAIKLKRRTTIISQRSPMLGRKKNGRENSPPVLSDFQDQKNVRYR